VASHAGDIVKDRTQSAGDVVGDRKLVFTCVERSEFIHREPRQRVPKGTGSWKVPASGSVCAFDTQRGSRNSVGERNKPCDNDQEKSIVYLHDSDGGWKRASTSDKA
jgi:hypothetical protein